MNIFKGFKELISKQQNEESNEPVLSAVISNTVLSELYQDMLRLNDIPFICRQQGAGGYLKILAGGLLASDSIYVHPRNLERAKELYELYVKDTLETELSDSEE